MSVFQNLYTNQFENEECKSNWKKFYEDFNYFDNYMTTLLNTFTWSNLPDKTLPPFMVEYFFQYAGMVWCGTDKDDGELHIYPCQNMGKMQYNAVFDKVTIMRPNGTSFVANTRDGVLGFNNAFRMPYYYKVLQFARKTSYAHRAVDKALEKAIMPVLINTADESMLKELQELRNNKDKILYPFLVSLKGRFDTKDIDIKDIYDNTKIDVLALWDVTTRYRNLFYSTFGINNVEIQKRERLTEAEGSGNDEIVRYTLLDDMYKRRKEFCEGCKEKFNLDIEFSLNRDISTVYQLSLDNDDKVNIGNIAESRGATIQQDNKSPDEEVKEDENEENS